MEDVMGIKDLEGSLVLISKSYCKSQIMEVDVMKVRGKFVKLQTSGTPNPWWERMSDIKVELILKKEEYENTEETE